MPEGNSEITETLGSILSVECLPTSVMALVQGEAVIFSSLWVFDSFAGAMLLSCSLCVHRPCSLVSWRCRTRRGACLSSWWFFLEYGRCRIVARSLHEHKQYKRHLYKDRKGPEMQANHNKTNHHTDVCLVMVVAVKESRRDSQSWHERLAIRPAQQGCLPEVF